MSPPAPLDRSDLDKLRERAEALLEAQGKDLAALSPLEAKEAVHRLRTYQVELEMQNEQMRQVQDELLAAHERLTDLYDFAPVGYVTLSERGMILEANHTLTDMLGLARGGLTRMRLSALVHSEDQDVYYRAFRRAMQTGEGQACELRLIKKGGAPVWVSVDSSPVFEGVRRTPSSLRIAISDVTERRRAQELVKASATAWESTFDAMEEAVANTDAEGLITRCNQATARFLGKRVDELVGHSCWGLFYEPGRPVEASPYSRMVQSHHRETGEFQRNGRWLRVAVDPLLGADGELEGAVHTMMDMTEHERQAQERRELELGMQRAQKLESLGVLAGGIAHDFNNILCVILSNADLALSTMRPGSPGADSLEEIRIAAERASGLTSQMLAYSGGGALVIEKLDLSFLVQEMSHLLEISHTKNAIVTCEFEDRMPAVAGDASKLRQVVMNLITNSSEALGGSSGSILLQTGRVAACASELSTADATGDCAEGDFVFLRVKDSGCGMDRATQDRMFEPFFTTKFTGRGLGMAAVRGIVQTHGGTIQVESEVDRGTTVTVCLPALGELPAPNPEDVRRADGWSSTATVLVADDEPQIRLLLKRILESRGMRVLLAEDGQQAVETFRQNMDEIACVVLDLTMPHVGGDLAFDQMKQLREGVRGILISGYSEDHLKDSLESLGFASFLTKPLTAGGLLTEVRTVLGS